MEQVRIRTGRAEVVASGTVIAFEGSPIEVSFGPADNSLTLIFAFEDLEEAKDLSVAVKILGDRTLQLTLRNFNKPLGAGSTAPLHIGTFGRKRLYLHYRVFDLGTRDKTLHYTLYAGEEVQQDE